MSACIDWNAVLVNGFILVVSALALLGIAFLSLLFRD